VFVGEDNWTFFREIYDDLSMHYETVLFSQPTYRVPFLRERLNGWAFRRAVGSVLTSTDLCFFEWASNLLAPASHLPHRARIVTRLHSFELLQWAPRIDWGAVARIIVLSRAMQTMFGERYPEHRDKLVVVRNGRSLSRFAPVQDRPFTFTIGMLGHIAPIKRVYEMVLVLHELVVRGYPARLRLAGDPADDLRYNLAVHRLVRQLDLTDRVSFDGFVADTPAWLHQVDIFVSNSYWEGQQVALLEAMAAGCYCLCHGWAGADEVLPSANLFVTASELRDKIIEHSRRSEIERHDARVRVREIACQRFDITETCRQIRLVLDEL